MTVSSQSQSHQSSTPVAAAVSRWLSQGYVPADAPLIVACSGGADSLALAEATREVARDRLLVAAVVDHELQEGSAQVTRTAIEQLRSIGYERVESLTVTVSGPGGLESAARTARYAALRQLADAVGAHGSQGSQGSHGPPSPQPAVLLGHTADDQAETVLLGLARGSGPRSIAGMRPWRAPWGRPLLEVRRADTENACLAAGLDPWYDPHNSAAIFTRVRLRHEVLPLLDDVLGGGVTQALARTAELMADDLAALTALAQQALAAATVGDELACGPLIEWPSAIRRRALRSWVAQQTQITTLTYEHLVRLENLVIRGRSDQSVRLPGAIDAVRSRPRDGARSGAMLVLRPVTPGRCPPWPGVAG